MGKSKQLKPKGYKKPKIDWKEVTWQTMRKIPADETELVKAPVWFNMQERNIVDEWLKVTDIKSQFMQDIYLGDEEQAIQSINAQQRDNKWEKNFQFDLLMAFWLAVHYGRYQVLNHLMTYDIYLRQLVTLALKGKPERPRGFKAEAHIQNLSEFDRNAGITPETQNLAGFKPKVDLLNTSQIGKRRGTLRDRKNSSILPPIETKSANMDGFQEQKLGPSLSSVHPAMNEEINLNPDKPQNVRRELFEGGSKEDDGNYAEFDEDQQEQFGGNQDSGSSGDSIDDYGEDEGEGEEEQNSDGPPGGERGDIDGYEAPTMKKRERSLSTMNSMDREGINENADDDSQGQFVDQKDSKRPTPPDVNMKSRDNEKYLIQRGITGQDIEMMTLESDEQCETLKTMFRIYYPSLMAQIADILLFKKEEKLACLLTAYYELSIRDQSYIEAVKNKNFKWLEFVWAFGKNYTGSRRQETAVKMNIKSLMDIVSLQWPDYNRQRECCKYICEWQLLGDKDEDEHNVLWALLSQMLDQLALEYMGFYFKYLNKGLFVFALSNNNTEFMKEALKLQAFEKTMYSEAKVVSTVLQMFKEDKSKTNFILNVLLLTQVTLWKPFFLEELIDIFDVYTDGEDGPCQLLLSYNPLMSIALTCDLLTQIAESRKMYRDKCTELQEMLLDLGAIYSEKIDDEDHYSSLISDMDFNGRSVLHIICYSKFQQLLNEDDPKAQNLIRNIWKGAEYTKCDGSLVGYSNMTYILTTAAKRADAQTTFFDLISQGFVKNFKLDYTFQFRYRSKAISEYFLKEMVLGLIIVWTFHTINADYRELFKGPLVYIGMIQEDPDSWTSKMVWGITDTGGTYDFDNLIIEPQITDTTERIALMAKHLQLWAEWYPMILIFNGSLCYSVASKVLFNMFAKPDLNFRVPYDMWTKFDLVSAVATLIGFPYILSTSPEEMITKEVKDQLDYVVLVLILLQWGRFYMFFLIVAELSKMILTFISMVIDTMPFMFLVSSYLIVVSAIFTTVFQDVNPGKYENFILSLRTMFDGLMASYSYQGFGEDEYLHMMMLILHICLANILLLNYLIAILSDSYANMLDKGVFLYKVYRYQYCQHYMVAMANENYGQLVIQPAPMCIMNFPIVVLTLITKFIPKELAERALSATNNFYALTMFWIENIVWIVLFMAYEIALIPLVYAKNIFTVAWATQGMFSTLFNTAAWIMTGPVFIAFFIMRDVWYLFRLMTMHQGCKVSTGVQDDMLKEEVDLPEETRLYNQAREAVIEEFYDILWRIKQNKGIQKEEGDDEINYENILDVLQDEEVQELIEENRAEFSMKCSTLVMNWKKKQITKMKTEEDAVKTSKEKEVQKETIVVIDQVDEEAKIKEQKEKEQQKDGALNAMKTEFVNREKGETEKIVEGYIKQHIANDVPEEEQEDPEIEVPVENKEDDEEDLTLGPTSSQTKIVEAFFTKFLINSEGSSSNDYLDITWLLMAIPTKIFNNIENVKMFHFIVMQDAIVAYDNVEQVTSFDFYDRKNKKRVGDVKELVMNQFKNLLIIEQNLMALSGSLDKNEKFIDDYNELVKQWTQERNEIANRTIEGEVNELEKNNGVANDGKKRGGKGKKKRAD